MGNNFKYHYIPCTACNPETRCTKKGALCGVCGGLGWTEQVPIYSEPKEQHNHSFDDNGFCAGCGLMAPAEYCVNCETHILNCECSPSEKEDYTGALGQPKDVAPGAPEDTGWEESNMSDGMSDRKGEPREAVYKDPWGPKHRKRKSCPEKHCGALNGHQGDCIKMCGLSCECRWQCGFHLCGLKKDHKGNHNKTPCANRDHHEFDRSGQCDCGLLGRRSYTEKKPWPIKKEEEPKMCILCADQRIALEGRREDPMHERDNRAPNKMMVKIDEIMRVVEETGHPDVASLIQDWKTKKDLLDELTASPLKPQKFGAGQWKKVINLPGTSLDDIWTLQTAYGVVLWHTAKNEQKAALTFVPGVERVD